MKVIGAGTASRGLGKERAESVKESESAAQSTRLHEGRALEE